MLLSEPLLALVTLVVQLHLCLLLRQALGAHVRLHVQGQFFLALEDFTAGITLVDLLLLHQFLGDLKIRQVELGFI